MVTPSPRRVLVLGGIRSGKSEVAENLLAGAGTVRYVATARHDSDDREWSARIDAHRDRRPGHWTTAEEGGDPAALAGLLREAGPDEAVLVDDLGNWVAGGSPVPLADLVSAVEGCRARLVLVSPEVGLSLVPA